MSSYADEVLWLGRLRCAHWRKDLGFGRQRQSDGSLMVALGRAGHFRISVGDHRVVMSQPLFKRG